MPYLYLTIAFVLNAAANIILKISSRHGFLLQGLKGLEVIAKNSLFIGGILLFGINAIFYYLALRSVPLSTAYPVMVVMSFLIINSYAYLGLGEKINLLQIIGYVLIVIGLVFVVYFTEKV